MGINGRRGDMLDSLIELVGVRSGLVLRRSDIIRLLEQEGDQASSLRPGPWWQGDPGGWVRVRAEELEADFTHVLYLVGVLPDSRTTSDLQAERIRQRIASGEIASLRDYLRDGAPPHEDTAEFQRRFLLHRDLPETRSWDEPIPLADLFESESLPAGSAGYFDQRYIDYLASRGEEIQAIHWRQFEHLTAEFFARNGYEVEITPPRGDGGVDVIARREDGVVGPELVIVQCKRYGPDNTVKIEEVKAFWATLDDAGATRGLVATTSQLEAGARAYCSARQYRLSAAEGDHVREWLRQLASPDARRD